MKSLALAFAFVVLGLANAWAGGFEIIQQSASAAGTASAGTARSGDPSAAWFNPAALADGQGFRAGLGGALAFPSFEATAADGSWKGETASSMSTPAYLYLSYASDDWALGLSANVPFASGVNWPADWAARFDTISSEPMFFRAAPFVAYRIGPVALSAGVHVDMGKVESLRGLDFIQSEGQVRLLISGYGVGGHASAFYRVTDWLDLGVAYKSRTSMRLTGDADFTTPDTFAYRAQDQAAEADFTLPDKLTFGALARFDDFTVVMDIGFTLWSVNKELVVEFENDETDDSIKPANWSTSFFIRAGGEWAPNEWVTARLGTYFDQSPIPDSTLTPSSPDCNRTGLTLGVSGHPFDWVSIDLYYDMVAFLERSSKSDTAALATYSGLAHFVGLGLRFHLPAE